MDGLLSCLKCSLNILQCILHCFSLRSGFFYLFILLKISTLPVSFWQGFELLLSALGDPSERVVSATHQVFLPAYAAWTTELGNLQSHLIPTLLNKIEKLLRVNAFFYLDSLQKCKEHVLSHLERTLGNKDRKYHQAEHSNNLPAKDCIGLEPEEV